jgi:hypothetical protein
MALLKMTSSLRPKVSVEKHSLVAYIAAMRRHLRLPATEPEDPGTPLLSPPPKPAERLQDHLQGWETTAGRP